MLTYSQNYLPQLQAYQPELLERLALLVNIDSGSGQIEGVNAIMAYLEQWLRHIGFDVTLHNAEQFGHNLVARLTGKGRLRLLLVGHVDTVYKVGAVAIQPFQIRDGLAYGPGVIDMKSGVLMGLYAVRALVESGFREFSELYIVFNNDEEVGSMGSADLLREHTLYPGVTFNVTRISSSELYNIVPDHARCFISVRAFTEQGLEMAASGLEQIAAGRCIPDTRTRLTRMRGRKPYQATPEILHMIEMAKQEGQALGLAIRQEGKGGLSDANLLMEAGLPTLDSLGPTGGGMHDLNREYLQLDSIPVRGALLAGLIVRLCLSESTGAEQSA